MGGSGGLTLAVSVKCGGTVCKFHIDIKEALWHSWISFYYVCGVTGSRLDGDHMSVGCGGPSQVPDHTES